MTDEADAAKQSRFQDGKGARASDAARSQVRSSGKRNIRSGCSDASRSIETIRSCNQDQNMKKDQPREVQELADFQKQDCQETPSSHHKYFYTERERYLPLANISRSVKDVVDYAMPGRNVRISKEGKLQK